MFNYTISENILYGSPNAYNRELDQATSIANAREFIESQQIANAFDDSAESLYQEMLRNRDSTIKVLGEKEYDELLEVLDNMRKEESKKGRFMAVEGDID